MPEWIEPFDFQTLLINVFAGNATIFSAIAIFVIISLSGVFKMGGLTLGFMIIVFLLMFSGYVPASLVIFASIFAGLLVGYIIPKLVKN